MFSKKQNVKKHPATFEAEPRRNIKKHHATSEAGSSSPNKPRWNESSTMRRPRSAPSLKNPGIGLEDVTATVEGQSSGLENLKNHPAAFEAANSSSNKPRRNVKKQNVKKHHAPSEAGSSSSLKNPVIGVEDVTATAVEGQSSGLEIFIKRAQETDLCVFCDYSTCEQANLGRKTPKTFPRTFSAFMRCRRCGLSVCNLCVGILLKRMAKIPGCDPYTWDNAHAFLEAVSRAECGPESILCCVTPIGHCCEHKKEITTVAQERKNAFDEIVSNVSAAYTTNYRVLL
jgi:hypothetical protein